MNCAFRTQFLTAKAADTFIVIDGNKTFCLVQADTLGRTGVHTDTAAFAQVRVYKRFYGAKGSCQPDKGPDKPRAVKGHGGGQLKVIDFKGVQRISLNWDAFQTGLKSDLFCDLKAVIFFRFYSRNFSTYAVKAQQVF